MLVLTIGNSTVSTRSTTFTDNVSSEYPDEEVVSTILFTSTLGTSFTHPATGSSEVPILVDGYFAVVLQVFDLDDVLLEETEPQYLKITWNAEYVLLRQQLAYFLASGPDYLLTIARLDTAQLAYSLNNPFAFERILSRIHAS